MRAATLLLAASLVASVAARGGGVPHHIDPPPHIDPDPPNHPDTPDGSTTPEPDTISDPDPYLPEPEENPCFGEEGPSCEELLDKAKDVINDIISAVLDSSSGEPQSTAAAIASAVPMYDVAASITIASNALGVFDANELAMYSSNPLCFWANIERLYVSAATATATSTQPTGSSSTPASISAAPTVSLTTVALSYGYSVATYTNIGSSDAAVMQTYLFESLFPHWIGSIYAPYAPNATTRLVTSTTTCPGLDGAPSFTTPYLVKAASMTPTVSTSRGAAAPTDMSRAIAAAGVACMLGVGIVGAL